MFDYLSDVFRHAKEMFRYQTLHDDIIAGITVSLVAIPQSLAYAQLAGVPVYYGLYAGLIPTVIGALFGSSRQVSTGPVAMTSLLTAASVAPLAVAGTDTYIAYVILIALLSGIFQVLLGVFRVGILLNFLSHPVLIGFINAAAIIIGLAQIPTLLGISVHQSDHFLLDIAVVVFHIGNTNLLSFAFGIGALAVLIILKRIDQRFPAVLIVAVISTLVSYEVGYANHGGQVVGTIPAGLPSLTMPVLDWQVTMTLLTPAFVISLISFMEAMSSAKVISIKTRTPWNENHELIGQGLAKIAAAFTHSMPVSGSFSRSALNFSAGARTGLASIVSALTVLLTLLFFTSLLYHLPKPVLAAIIIMAVAGLINFLAIYRSWIANRDDGIAGIATFVATLAFAPHIQNGIVIGILLSLIMLLHRMMRPRVVEFSVAEDGTLYDATQSNSARLLQDIGVIRYDGALRFMNVSYFENALLSLEQNRPNIRDILIEGNGINGIDASGVAMLGNLITRFRGRGITLVFSGLKRQALDVIERSDLAAQIGSNNLYESDQDAITALLAKQSSHTNSSFIETGALSRVLVTTDGSSYTTGAVRVAIAIARQAQAQIECLSIALYNSANAAFTSSEGGESEKAVQRAMAAFIDESVEGAVTRIRDTMDPAQGIIDEANEIGADLIVMGRRGKRGLARMMVGDATVKVIGCAHRPVLVVPQAANIWQCHILLAFDGSEHSRRAAAVAGHLALQAGLPMTVISAVTHGDGEAHRKVIEQALGEQIIALRNRGITVAGRLVENWPSDAIVEEAAAIGADLIVMGSRGRTKLSTILLGSVAQRVISHTQCPVLVLTASALKHTA